MNEVEEVTLSGSEKLFKAIMPWVGVLGFFICLYYLLEQNREIPLIVFFIFGGMMGLGRVLTELKGIKS